MKIAKEVLGVETQLQSRRNSKWKILVVDDEPDIIKITKINLKNFNYLGRDLEFIEARSAKEARKKIETHPDIAIAIIDIVMETNDAGLRLIQHIRNDLCNTTMRLIIRTGQPDLFPEKTIVDKYDINDFKDKVELGSQKLWAAIRLSLKEYNNIISIEANKYALKHILHVTPHLYNLKLNHLEEYFHWVLNQLICVCHLTHTGMISTIEGMLTTIDGKDIEIQASVGDFELNGFNPKRREEIIETCKAFILEDRKPYELSTGSIVIPLKTSQRIFGFVYLECSEDLKESDFELVKILANQCAAGLDNFKLHNDLEKAYDQAIDMLAVMSEFKDANISGHIRRIQELTKRLSISLGVTESDVNSYTKASRLHDIGKVGIPDSVIHKPGRLTQDEFDVIISHTKIGDEILKNFPALDVARTVARSHHEKWDGNGYPDGLCGKEIPLVARIVSVVDVFDALASSRPYKKAWSMDKIIAELESAAGSQFDPIVVTTFLKILQNGELDDLIKEYEQMRTQDYKAAFSYLHQKA
ncbi:MAG: DUF3369 domain-containing protein [Holophagales bacterium]|nr:DUF3369 domain-containing protein [Holophagales bacterium]